MMMRAMLAAAVLSVGLLGWAVPAEAGRVPSPGYAVKDVAPYGSVTYRSEWFQGGEPAEVLVIGDDSTLLSVTVYDENGHYISSDSGTSCRVTWSPIWTGPFTIKVTNLGNSANVYVLSTN
jgi:hypothetical protein